MELAKEFEQNPMDFVLERDLQARLYELLQKRLITEDKQAAKFTCSTRLAIGDKTPDYKRDYVQEIEEDLRQRDGISRVHTEIAFFQPMEERHGREQFDVAILRDQIDRPFVWNDGSKRVDMDLVETAIELKYVKNKTGFPVDMTFDEVENNDIQTISDNINKDANDIRGDLDELTEVNDVYTTDVCLVIASNYDYLHLSDTHDYLVRRNEVQDKVGDAVVQWIQNEYSVPVLYTCPFTSEWIIEP